jgi:hypothetical protein
VADGTGAGSTLAMDAIRRDLRVHVRIKDQRLGPDAETLEAIVSQIPELIAFGKNEFVSLHAVLDWDHLIPSEFLLLRLYASYDRRSTQRLEAQLSLRQEAISDDNLYPEFDLPDYAELLASESYLAVLKPGSSQVDEFRLISEWRKQVPPESGRKGLAAVKASDSFAAVIATRANDALGGPVVVGWAPPCTAGAVLWAVEVWIITAFDGQQGTAHVFMVDPDTGRITREFNTTVQVA